MYLLNRAEVRALIDERAKKCVSVYLPTHRSGSEIQQDPIRFKNLLKQAEERLANGEMRRPEAQAILRPAQRLLDDDGFWRHQSDGLAVFHVSLLPPSLQLLRTRRRDRAISREAFVDLIER